MVAIVAVLTAACATFPRIDPPNAAKCLVSRAATGASYNTLASAVAQAGDGETLVVKGTCTGSTRIVGPRTLTIVGKANPAFGTPTLDGTGTDAPILAIENAVTITLRSLTLAKSPSVGLYVTGDPTVMDPQVPTVTLDAVTITGNRQGGIRNSGGQVYVNAGTMISHNSAQYGGGIHTDGISHVYLNAGSTITRNHASEAGGGVFLCECYGYTGGLTLAGGVVTGNTAPIGPDIYHYVFNPNE